MVIMLAKARKRVSAYTLNAVKLSVVDPLTGAVNVRGLRRTTGDAIERCVGTGLKPALVAIDLDEFKIVNDRFGHSMGDRMLRGVTSAMNDVLRVGDTLARRGGDEFAAVCLVNGEAEVNALAGRLADRIAEAREQLCPDLRPTATISHVLWNDGEDADAFLARADAELHGAKATAHAARVNEAGRFVRAS
jgi:diguanylate cyclase (GGDEF)-like protein